MGRAGSEEWAVFSSGRLSPPGYGAQQLAACLLTKWYVFLTAPECAHHTTCGTGLLPLPGAVSVSPCAGSQPVPASIRMAQPEK